MQEFHAPEELREAVGQELGHSDWIEIEQERINLFADATDDHQWIHVDLEKAREGPFGAPIAHGYLTLSLVNHFLPQLMQVHGAKMGINYGCNKVRFPSPVAAGSRIRATGQITEVETVPGGVQVVVRVSVENESGGKPACVAETVSRWIFE
ncbi:MAG: MaoC family dehydratase [Myxococcales bacterium]|nr:MaoC family dehydratase [Myxococcales bacterium]